MRNHIKLADIYCRLSDEEKKHKNESESITNQRAIIRDYCEKHDIIRVEVHFEDGTEETFEKGITLRQIWHEDVL